MTRRNLWLGAAVIFTAINLGGVFPAAADQEWLHAGTHVVLTLLGAYFLWRLARGSPPQALAGESEASERLAGIQQSVDAIALEVERVGEAQRYIDKVVAERAAPPPPKLP